MKLLTFFTTFSLVFGFGKLPSIAKLTSSALFSSFYEIVEKDATGRDVSFSKFKGKVVYGVNVASKCGYTASGYALLSKLSALKDKGVEVALFPCNQFGAQEPGSDAEVASFCALKGVKDANVFTKADVNGPNTRPTYKYLREKGVVSNVAWNFAGKFIVDKDGNVLPVKSEKTLEEDILKLASK
jgi:glutathione peroxidase